jgi:hypothetical protein
MRLATLALFLGGCSFVMASTEPRDPPRTECPSYAPAVVDGVLATLGIVTGTILIATQAKFFNQDFGNPVGGLGLIGSTPWLFSSVYGVKHAHSCGHI